MDPVNSVDPEDCLRALTAEALSWAHPERPLFPVSLGVMAVANAFVMLGLLPEPLAGRSRVLAVPDSWVWRAAGHPAGGGGRRRTVSDVGRRGGL